MDFEAVIGHYEIKQRLIEGLRSGRVPHAQLISGPDGSGALPLALAYAVQLLAHANTEAGYTELPDLQSKHKAEKLIHPDLHFVFPVNKSEESTRDNPISDHFIDKFRKVVLQNPYLNANDWYEYVGLEKKQGIINAAESISIADKMRLKPYEGHYKVMIIWMAEKMNLSAANKLLKLFEEPAGNAVFLLITENADAMLPTILSRTQLIKLGPLAPTLLREQLISDHKLNLEEAAFISRISGGSYRRCLQILQGSSTFEKYAEQFQNWMRLCFSKNVAGLLKFTDDINKLTREGQKAFLEYALHMVRDSIVKNAGAGQLQQTTTKEADFLEKFAPFINSANVLGFMEIFNDAIQDIERNVNSKMVLFDVSVRIMQLFNRKPTAFTTV